LHAGDLIVASVAAGYRSVDRELVTRDAEARRAFIEELLGAIVVDGASAARLRRHALRRGLDPDSGYRLTVIAADRSDADLEAAVRELTAGVGARSSAERARSGLRLPLIVDWRGRIVVLARTDWPGLPRLRGALDTVLGGSSRSHRHDWTAVVGHHVAGVERLAPALAGLVETLRAAERLGHRGWLDHPDELAVERLLLTDDRQLAVVVERELGPLLAEPRMGDELVETLEVYFEAGENMRETARRLHLANRTVAYRLERIEGLLGGPIDGPRRERLVVAMLARRILARVAARSAAEAVSGRRSGRAATASGRRSDRAAAASGRRTVRAVAATRP
jgi:sugar diacid utilization regulator